jgi:hypothetical protein
VGNLAGQCRKPRHLDQRRLVVCEFLAGLCKHCRGAPGHGLGNEVASVGLRPRVSNENISRLHTARIGSQAGRDHAICPELVDDGHGGIHISSRTGSALVITIGLAGASGATPRLRRLPPMT